MKRLHQYGIPLILFLLLTFPIHGQAASGDRKLDALWDKVTLAMNTDETTVKPAFFDYISYCQQNSKDSFALEGIDVITTYYMGVSNYFEAIHWYFYASDSLCHNGLGKCVKLRREFSELFSRIGDYDRAVEISQLNLQVMKANGRTAAEMIESANIATYYLYNHRYDSARIYYESALDASIREGKLHGIVHSYNNLGYYYLETDNPAKAEYHFLKGIDLLEAEPTSSTPQQRQLALLKGNLGGLYLRNGQADKAIPLLEEDMRVNLNSNEPIIGMNAALELAEYYYDQKQYAKAIEYLEKCTPLEKRVNAKATFVRIYEHLFKNAVAMGNLTLARKYHDAYETRREAHSAAIQSEKLGIEKSLLRNILQSQLEFQQKEIALKQKENEVLSERSRYLQLRSIIIGCAILVVAFFATLYFRKRFSMLRIKKQLAEQDLKLERIEKEKVDAELKYKNKDLTDFAIDLARKQEILQDLKEKLYELRNARLDELESKKRINELIQYANNNMLVDTQLMEFQRNIEEINYRFFDTLKERFPELTELDKQVCGLIRLGLSNKEIAIMRNVSYKAVRMSRYRIRKKMQLDSEDDMVDFLKSI